jgi:hypothetical protein
MAVQFLTLASNVNNKYSNGMKEQILKILAEGKKYGYSNEAVAGELLDLFSVMASASPTLDNIDYNYEKNKFYQMHNKNEYHSSELIRVYGLDADELCKIMLPHLP